jgi:hypothetical protein
MKHAFSFFLTICFFSSLTAQQIAADDFTASTPLSPCQFTKTSIIPPVFSPDFSSIVKPSDKVDSKINPCAAESLTKTPGEIIVFDVKKNPSFKLKNSPPEENKQP